MNWRKDFPALNDKQCYVDNAATTHKPQAVIDAVMRTYVHDYAPIYRGLYPQAEYMTELYEGVRSSIAEWLCVKSSEIVLTYGATDGMHTFISSWARHHITAGDEIVFTELDHHMVVASWTALAQDRGAKISVIPVYDTSCSLNLEVLPQIITERTRVVVLPVSSNIRGPLCHEEIKRIVDAARLVGALLIFDASQVPAHQSLAAVYNRWKPDVMIWSGHKSFGPSGVGVLYIAESLHQGLLPYQYGGGMLYSIASQSISSREMPRLLEAGTRSIEAVIGLGAAMNYIKNIDYNLVRQHEARMVTEVLDGISDIPGICILGTQAVLKKQGHMVAFAVQGVHSHDIALYLAEQGIAVRAGDHCCQPLHDKLGISTGSVRISFALYNTIDEARKIVIVLREAMRCLR